MATPLETLLLAETGLVALYLLNETSGTAAVDSKGTNNGIYQNGGTGGYTLNQSGIITSETNNCPTFVNAHTGCVTIPTAVAPTGTNPYTWEAWVFPTLGSVANMHVFGYDNSTPNGPALMFDKPNNLWHTWRSSPAVQLSAAAGPISTLYHIVKTYDGRTLRIYVNAQSRGGVVDTTSIGTVATSFIIGATGGFGASWDGKIQYVALYNVALTGAQIKKHYRQGINSLLTANNSHSYGAYLNTGQSWDASPPANYGELDTWTGWATNNGASTHKPGIFHCFANWANNAHFPSALASQANQRGADLMVTWEAWNPGPADQPAYSLYNIANTTNFDAYITTWAQEIKAYGFPLFLRLFHEFNAADYYPWGLLLDANNGNQADYPTPNTEALLVAAWKKVHDIFTAQGVTNVKWVWCPNVFSDNLSSHPFTSASYPGDTYVDYAGLDGYNTNTNSGLGFWPTFFDLYSQAYDVIAATTSKPIMVPEMACTEDSTAFYTKAGWITQALGTDIPQAFPAITSFVWEDDIHYPTYPSTISINSSPAALAAFQAQVASSQYAAGTPLALPSPPALTTISPTTATAGTTFTLTATGTGFTTASAVAWAGTALTTTFVSSTTLTATVTPTQDAAAGTYPVTVVTPALATTAAVNCVVATAAVPTIASLNPSSATAGAGNTTLTVSGGGFVAASVVQWNGTALATTYVNATTLTAVIPAADLVSAGTDIVTVVNP